MKVSGTWSCRVDRSPLIHSSLVTGCRVLTVFLALGTLAYGCGSSDAHDDQLSAACDAEVEKSLDGLPDSLTCTGLYSDFAKKRVARQMREYTPAFPLWSDGAEKRRWMGLPEDTKIDATSNSEWRFPVGTKFFKEFSVDGRRIETRLFEKTRGDRWARASYAWNEDESDAIRSKGGDLPDVKINGAVYHVPTGRECDQCHEGKDDRILGFDAISLGLAGAKGVSLQDLVDEALIEPAPKRTSLKIGDDGTKRAAAVLGWLNINCGMPCHNDNSNSEGYSSRLRLQLDPAQLDGRPANEFKSIKSTVGVAGETLRWSEEIRIVPGSPERSLLYKLITSRAGENDQMPPIGSRVVDDEAAAAVKAWISAMHPVEDEVSEDAPALPDAEPPPPRRRPEPDAEPAVEPETAADGSESTVEPSLDAGVGAQQADESAADRTDESEADQTDECDANDAGV